MAISNYNQMINGQINTYVFNKVSGTSVSSQWYSLWSLTGYPGAGDVPSVAKTCEITTSGSLQIRLGGSKTTYLKQVKVNQVSVGSLQICDRLCHIGGLSGTSTSAQTVNLNLVSASNSERCQLTGTDVQWYFQWYGVTGTTAVTATVNYTNQDGVSGKTTTVAIASSRPIYCTVQIYPHVDDISIKSIQSITLSATTGAAGNFGITAIKPLVLIPNPTAYSTVSLDYGDLGLVKIPSTACLCLNVCKSGTSTGIIQVFITTVRV